jgi:hypothetical protein
MSQQAPRDSVRTIRRSDTTTRRRARAPWSRPILAAAAATALAVIGLVGPGAPPAAAANDYLLLSRSQLMALPTSGSAWSYIVNVAHSAWPAPELDDQDSKTNVQALAAALVYARTGDTAMRAKARAALDAMLPTYNLSQDAGLGPARQIAGWVLVADFIGLGGADDDAFRALLRRALTQPIGTHSRWGGSLTICQEDSDNNWGAWCAASRIAAALYLGDSSQLDQANRVLRGFLGDRNSWSRFRGEGSENTALTSSTRSWSCDASADAYVPTNPDCGDRGGAFPADAGRSGSYRTLDGMYQSETTAGVVLATELLYQNGYSGAWSFRGALARIARFDYGHGAWNLGRVQDHWPWLVNRRLGTSYPTVAARYGRSLGYTDWLYGHGSTGGDPAPTPQSTSTATTDATPKSHGPKKTATPSAAPSAGVATGTGTATGTTVDAGDTAAGTGAGPSTGDTVGSGTPKSGTGSTSSRTEGGKAEPAAPPAAATADARAAATWQLVLKLCLGLIVVWVALKAMRAIVRSDRL